MAIKWHNKALTDLMKGALNLQEAGIDIRVLLCTSYTDNPDHDEVADAIAGGLVEATHTNYVRKALANQTVTQDNTNDRAKFDADDVTWTTLGSGTAITGLVVYYHTGSDATSTILGYYDFAVTPNGGDVTASWSADGIAYLTG